MTRTSKDLAASWRPGFGVLGLLQFALAGLALWDLSHRPAVQIRGPKPMWVPVILINWIGPLAYFYVHRHR